MLVEVKRHDMRVAYSDQDALSLARKVRADTATQRVACMFLARLLRAYERDAGEQLRQIAAELDTLAREAATEEDRSKPTVA